jgi:hypothetical protein
MEKIGGIVLIVRRLEVDEHVYEEWVTAVLDLRPSCGPFLVCGGIRL